MYPPKCKIPVVEYRAFVGAPRLGIVFLVPKLRIEPGILQVLDNRCCQAKIDPSILDSQSIIVIVIQTASQLTA